MSAHWPPPPSFKPEPPAEEPLAVTPAPAGAAATAPPAPAPATAPPSEPAARDQRPWWRRFLSLLIVAGALLLKFGKPLLLLLPKLKILTTSATMISDRKRRHHGR